MDDYEAAINAEQGDGDESDDEIDDDDEGDGANEGAKRARA